VHASHGQKRCRLGVTCGYQECHSQKKGAWIKESIGCCYAGGSPCAFCNKEKDKRLPAEREDESCLEKCTESGVVGGCKVKRCWLVREETREAKQSRRLV
jgi:hypothetical protein